MNKKLYLECTSGISGDMFVAAMLDLGANSKKLQEALQSLSVQGFRTEITRVKKSGLDACDFHIILDKEHENHDHDME
ncbi:MAG: LarC family nickel insertion protein, partial [Lachnospiraceae bacterium]|nr:LarC family nickel insertion protein [Lachnospiraceae bacterium]